MVEATVSQHGRSPEKIVVTGGGGQLAQAITHQLLLLGHSVLALDHDQLDITNKESIDKSIEKGTFAIINCAAYTNVVSAETHSQQAHLVNGYGVELLASHAKDIGARFIHFSTDYVFDGEKTSPYDEVDATHPINEYGKSKLSGEQISQKIMKENLWILRTSWLYGGDTQHFVRKILEKLSNNQTIEVVTDQIGSPTYVGDVAEATVALLTSMNPPDPGIYHVSNRGEASWLELAQKTAEMSGYSANSIAGIETSSLQSAVKRPRYSVLDSTKWVNAGMPAMPLWQSSLKRYLEQNSAREHTTDEKRVPE